MNLYPTADSPLSSKTIQDTHYDKKIWDNFPAEISWSAHSSPSRTTTSPTAEAGLAALTARAPAESSGKS